MTLKKKFLAADELSRRAFISNSAKTLLGLGAMPLFSRVGFGSPLEDAIALGPATARNVIYLFMSGGMSQLDTFDTKPGADTQGPVESLKTNAEGVRVSQYFPNMARHMDKVAVINSMTSTQGAHAQGRYFMHTSYQLRGTIKHPSLGAWLSRMAGKTNPTLPGHVAIGGGRGLATEGFLGPMHAPLPIGNPDDGLANSRKPQGVGEADFDRRLARLAKMNEAFSERYDHDRVDAYHEMYDEAVSLMNSSDLAAFDITQEDDSLREAYGRNGFGQGCLLARRLVENGVRFIEVVSGGWDTHNQNFDSLEELCPNVDQGIAALLADLECRGLLEETLVVVATEFGRTPDIEGSRDGRNHYPQAFTCLMAGGGIVGGRTFGRTDETGREIVENPVTVPDFNATIAHALGLPLEHKVFSASGRPFTVADKGQAVTALFA